MRAICWSSVIIVFVLTSTCLNSAHAFMPNLYCGSANCYSGYSSDFSPRRRTWCLKDTAQEEITKAYRKLASRYHPDRAKGDVKKKEAEEQFIAVANAYETLKDEESRQNYDYMLDNPELVYRHYWRYYNRKMPKVDARLVIVGSILLVSVIQYVGWWHKYNEALAYLVNEPKYRMRASEIAKERGLLDADKKKRKRDRQLTKEEQKQEEARILRAIIAETVDIQGGYGRPQLTDTLGCRLVLWPMVDLPRYLAWNARWMWKFWLKGEEYGEEEKLYIIRRRLKLSSTQFDAAFEDKTELLELELWKGEKFEEWQKEKQDEAKEKAAQSSAYKRYRRYMRNHGPGQMTFAE